MRLTIIIILFLTTLRTVFSEIVFMKVCSCTHSHNKHIHIHVLTYMFTNIYSSHMRGEERDQSSNGTIMWMFSYDCTQMIMFIFTDIYFHIHTASTHTHARALTYTSHTLEVDKENNISPLCEWLCWRCLNPHNT